MNDNFFTRIDKNDPLRVMKEFFNTMNDFFFVSNASSLANGIGLCFEWSSCEFPDDIDGNEEPFSGVRFSYFDDEIVVSEAVFCSHLKDVCQEFLKRHPQSREQLLEIINKLDSSVS
jgi:hypothetical protein